MTHPSGHIEHVANQWRVHDHTTGGLWAMHSEEQAQSMLRALELRDAAPRRLERTWDALLTLHPTRVLEVAEELPAEDRAALADHAEDSLRIGLARQIRNLPKAG